MAVKYLEVANILRQQIVKEIYDDKLPTETEMTRLFSVSKITIKRAIKLLEAEELIYTIQGSGIYVNKNQKSILRSSYQTQMIGFKKSHALEGYETHVHSFKIINCPLSVQNHLDLSDVDQVYEIIRLRKRNGITERYELTYIPLAIVPNLTKEICAQSIYDYISINLKTDILRTHDYFFATLATDQDKELLNASNEEVVINLEQIGFLKGNLKFQYSLTKYKYNFFDFKVISKFDSLP